MKFQKRNKLLLEKLIETGLATIKTIETLKSAENLIESLNIYLEEQNKLSMYNQGREILKTQEEKDKVI